ncbi:MAG: HEAT repeat domain-containing protein [Candidatus Heimdallarchaeota archaeon]|nr:HEAT repeat domain-containing protein [Candidatus Heimdallarchaeota archaeon]
MTAITKEIDDLVDELKWGHPETRKKAAIKLGRIRDIRVIPHLVNTLENDEYSYARVSAIQSLLWIADQSIIDVIMKIAEIDKDDLVRKTAIEALGSLKIKSTLPRLEKILHNDQNAEIKKITSNAIEVINGKIDSWESNARPS